MITPIRQEDKLAPHSVEAEEGALGSVLIDPSCLPQVAAAMEPEDLHDPALAAVYRAMLELQRAGRPVDQLTVHDSLNGNGDAGLLFRLVEAVPTSIHAEHYARIVAEKAARRRLMDAGALAARLGHDEGTPLGDALDGAMEALLAARPRDRRAARPMSDLVRDYYDRVEFLARSGVPPGIPTGYADLDALLEGLHDANLVILAARPAMGKTALALNVALKVARLGKKVGFFSLEMSQDELVRRLVSIDSAVPLSNLKRGKLADAEWGAFMRSVDALERLPVHVDDTATLTPQELRARALLLDAEVGGLDLVVVDYLQLMRAEGKRYEVVTEISGELKALAKDMNVPVLALSQLNRGCESRLDKRPKLSDLRESGALEQDAHVVLFLYRDEVYDEDTERPNIADVIVAKNRDGATGTAALFYEKALTRFQDAEVRRTDLNGDVGREWV